MDILRHIDIDKEYLLKYYLINHLHDYVGLASYSINCDIVDDLCIFYIDLVFTTREDCFLNVEKRLRGNNNYVKKYKLSWFGTGDDYHNVLRSYKRCTNSYKVFDNVEIMLRRLMHFVTCKKEFYARKYKII